MYTNVWMIHYTEDVPERAYLNWTCKSIATKDANSEISSMPDFGKMQHIYQSMVKIGNDAKEM